MDDDSHPIAESVFTREGRITVTRYVPFVMVALVACGMSDTQRPAELTHDQIADTAYHHLRTHLDLMMAGRVDEGLEYYLNSPDLVYASDGSIIVGWDSVASLMHTAMAGIEEWLAIELFEPQIYVLGQDAVTISVRYEERFIPVGGDLTTVRGNWTVVWKRFAEGWKAVHIGAAHIREE